jgi:hypothetical protein
MAIRLDELENLLNRIWSGELKHDQKDYYSSCGTAACVCGWDYAIDMHEGCLANAIPNDTCAWNYSKTKYELTSAESKLLFNGRSTKLLQQTVLAKLKEGRSIVTDSGLCVLSKKYTSPHVSVSSTSRYGTECLEKFFEGTSIKIKPC